MLSNLRIKNFRMLEDLEIAKLGRVNLIVGKNNSGKSTILEALRIYAGKANTRLLREILQEHDEYFNIDRESGIDNPEQKWYPLKSLFPNRQLPTDENSFISITSGEKSLIRIEYVFYYIKKEIESDENGDVIKVKQQRITINSSDISNLDDVSEINSAIQITIDSGRTTWLDLARSNNASVMSGRLGEESELPRYGYVSTQFLASEMLAKLWDKITLSPNEDTVLFALKIIEPEVERLAFVENRNINSSQRSSRIPIVKVKNLETPLPLSSMGDGMSRIMQLILSAFPAKNGILLIDEFENGLHFSVQEEVWRMIFKLAKELDMQVFATSHSWDCIESFAKIANESPEEGILLKVSRSKLTSDNGKVIATIYDKDALKIVTATDLEVR